MLIDETDDELLDRITSVIYILAERMSADDLQVKIQDAVSDALSDVAQERDQ